jgi:hypothetical protein
MQARLIAQYRLEGFDGGKNIALLALKNTFLEKLVDIDGILCLCRRNPQGKQRWEQ